MPPIIFLWGMAGTLCVFLTVGTFMTANVTPVNFLTKTGHFILRKRLFCESELEHATLRDISWQESLSFTGT
jgi:hypothetical protein